MAYTTPATWSTGQVVTASQLNEQIRDNIGFLYGALSYSSTINYVQSFTGTTRLLDTVYQNTTPRLMFCAITVTGSSTNGGITDSWIGTTNTTDILVDQCYAQINLDTSYTTRFYIPPSYYYKHDAQINAHLLAWTETLLGQT